MTEFLAFLGVNKVIAAWSAIGALISVRIAGHCTLLGNITSLLCGWFCAVQGSNTIITLWPQYQVVQSGIGFLLGICSMSILGALSGALETFIRNKLPDILTSWLKKRR